MDRSAPVIPTQAAGTAPPGSPGVARVIHALEVVRDLVTRLDRAGIRFCQFKSNRHLNEGVGGITDLDVLVERSAGPMLSVVLGQSGFKRFSAPPGGDYPAVEDYLGMDTATGRLVHLHLHHRLTTGVPHLKGHRIPWEELVLTTRLRDEDSGFWVSEPNVELLFLLARGALKVGLSDRLAAWWGQDRVRAGLMPEYLWLRERIQLPRVIELGGSLLGADVGPALESILSTGPSLGRLLALRRRATPVLRRYRTHGPAGALLERWRRQLQSLRSKIGRRFRRVAGPVSRIDPRGGIIIAFMGPDGAGKSRLTSEVALWLNWKLDARVIYFGSGDGPSSLVRRPLKIVLALARGLKLWPKTGGRSDVTDERGPSAGHRGPSTIRGLALACWALALAFEKRHKLERAWRARNSGIVVVCDRYPQNQIMGFNDGPLLSHWDRSRSGLLRALARWESTPYRWAEDDAPDLIVKLHVSPAVAVRRKAEMLPEEIQKRSRALARLCYPAGTRVVDLDADRPWDDVLLDAKREVWGGL